MVRFIAFFASLYYNQKETVMFWRKKYFGFEDWNLNILWRYFKKREFCDSHPWNNPKSILIFHFFWPLSKSEICLKSKNEFENDRFNFTNVYWFVKNFKRNLVPIFLISVQNFVLFSHSMLLRTCDLKLIIRLNFSWLLPFTLCELATACISSGAERRELSGWYQCSNYWPAFWPKSFRFCSRW